MSWREFGVVPSKLQEIPQPPQNYKQKLYTRADAMEIFVMGCEHGKKWPESELYEYEAMRLFNKE